MAELSAHAPAVRGRGAGGRGKGSRSAQRKGEAQQATAAGLDLLRVLGWLVLHDASVAEDAEGSIDHVLAGPSGVYVVNTVDWSGPIAVQGDVLTVGGSNRSEALADVAAAAEQVRRLLGAIPVAPLLCFERLEPVTGVAGDVALCASENILDLLTTQPEILDPAAVTRASRSLSAAFQAGARQQVRAVEPSPSRTQPSSGPTVDDLVRARSEESPQTPSTGESRAADAARIESLEQLMGGSEAPVVSPDSSIPQEPSRRHRFGLRRGSKKPAPAPEPTALVEPPADVDAPVDAAPDEVSPRVRSSDACAVGDAGAALWLALTDAPDGVSPNGVAHQELQILDDEAALDGAEEQLARERAQEEADQAAEQLRRHEADQARKRAAEEARENLEREARALAEQERLEQEAREQAEREAAARLEREAREQAEREAAARLEQERLEREAREQAEREVAARL
jgi:hypothetical protein